MINAPSSISSWPCFTVEEADAVSQVLLSNKVNYWTGNECIQFEKEFASWAGANYSIALANGTLALELALESLGIGIGDEVIVTPRTFIASISCVVKVGAVPVFADVDLNSGNITAETISRVATSKTKAIIPVHLGGFPCDMDPIMDFARKYNLKVIEDCAQAHGARYKGRSVGSIGDVGAWSFCQDKIMTTGGEGGMVTTNDSVLWAKMWSFKDHGKSYSEVNKKDNSLGFRWLHESFGTNFRMTEMQAVIGRIQLRRMSEWTKKRTHNADLLRAALSPFSTTYGPIRLPALSCSPSCIDTFNDNQGCGMACTHAYYKFYAYVRPQNLSHGWSRDRIIKAINQRGVPCYYGSCSEVYLEKAFDGTGWRPPASLSVAKELGETSLMFLVHPTLTNQEMLTSASVISQVLAEASIPLSTLR